jgi:hypothetical protein
MGQRTTRDVAPAASEYKCLLPGQPGIYFWLLINLTPKRRSLFFPFLNAFMLVVWMHALNFIQQDCSERQCKCLDSGLHWFTKQALHMLLQHKIQVTAKGSLLLHVPSLYVQNVFTLSLLQAV